MKDKNTAAILCLFAGKALISDQTIPIDSRCEQISIILNTLETLMDAEAFRASEERIKNSK
jgi:hypothetical protein